MLNTVPAILRVGIVFVFVLFAIRRKLSLGNAFMMGALILSILFGMHAFDTLTSMLGSILYLKTLCLAVIVGLILILSSSMETAGQMKRLLARFQGLVSNPRLNLIIFPALIGLLPMPGGAVFSAPMVKEIGQRHRLSGDQSSFINYWFRHIWEYWWPMYPGVLLATIMADLNIFLFVAALFPLTLVALYLGWRPIRGMVPGKSFSGVDKPPLGPFFKELTPIMIVIVPGIFLGLCFSRIFSQSSVSKEAGLIVSLCMGIFWIWYVNGFSRTRITEILKNKHVLKMTYMVFAILIFKGILTDSQAVQDISKELMQLRVPLVLISIFLPFLVGLVTGITIAFVGSAFPILIPLIQAQGEAQLMLAYIMLAMVCGFAGVLLSPLHLCLILSNEYFETSPGLVYRKLWGPCLGLMAAGCGYFWILSALGT